MLDRVVTRFSILSIGPFTKVLNYEIRHRFTGTELRKSATVAANQHIRIQINSNKNFEFEKKTAYQYGIMSGNNNNNFEFELKKQLLISKEC